MLLLNQEVYITLNPEESVTSRTILSSEDCLVIRDKDGPLLEDEEEVSYVFLCSRPRLRVKLGLSSP